MTTVRRHRKYVRLRAESGALILLFALAGVLFCGRALGQLPALGPSERELPAERDADYIYRSFTFRDVEIPSLINRLRRFGIRMPIDGSGQVTATIAVGVPRRDPLTLSKYRLEAELHGESVVLQGMEIHDLSATADYRNGRLRLEQLSFSLWDSQANRRAGTLRGAALLPVLPPGDLQVRLSVEEINLAQIARLVPDLPIKLGGHFTGTLSASAPFYRLNVFDAWHAEGRVSSSVVKVDDFPAAEINTDFLFERGMLALLKFQATAGQSELRASGQLNANAPFEFRVEIERFDGELDELTTLIPRFNFQEPVTGHLALSGSLTGELQSLSWSTSGTANVNGFAFRGVKADETHFDFQINEKSIRLTNLSSRLYQGTLRATVVLAVTPPADGQVDVEWNNLQVGMLIGDLLRQTPPIQGASRGRATARIPSGQLRSPIAWNVAGTATVSVGAVGSIPFREISGRYELRNEEITVMDLRGQLADGELLAAARVGARAPYPAKVNYRLRGLNLSAFAQYLPLNDATGRISAMGSAKGNLFGDDLITIGAATLTNAGTRGIRVQSAQFRYGISQHGLVLRNVDSEFYGGRVQGSAVIPFASTAPGNAELTCNGVELRDLVVDLGLSQPVSGTLNGEARLTLPGGIGLDWKKLVGSLQITIERFNGFGVRNVRLTTAVRLEQEEMNLSAIRVSAAGWRLDGTGRIQLNSRYSFSAAISSQGSLASLPLVSSMLPGAELSGAYSFSANAEGSAAPFEIALKGSGRLRDVRVAAALIDSVAFDFEANPQTISINSLEGKLYDGSIQGSAVIPLSSMAAGNAEIQMSHLDVGQLIQDVVRLPFRLSAPTDAKIRARIPAGVRADPQRWQVHAELKVPSIAINASEIGQLHAALEWSKDLLSFAVDGHLLGGQLNAIGRRQLNSVDVEANSGSLRLNGVQLSRLAAAFPRNPRLRGLEGTLELSLPFEFSADHNWPTGVGTILLTDLRWRQIVLANRIEGIARVRPGWLELANINGRLAGGNVRASAVFNLNEPARSRFEASLDRVRSEALLAAWPSLAGYVSGLIDAQFQGTLGRPWRAAGIVGLNNGKLLGLEATAIRLPMSIQFDPASTSFAVECLEGTGQLSHGRVRVQLSASGRSSLTINTKVAFTDVDLQPLLQDTAGVSQIGASRATGTLTLTGNQVQTLNDLTGSLQLQLRNVHASGFPLAERLRPYLTGGLSEGFQEGELRARIARGVVIVERLSLSGNSALAYASGRITLSGALDLDVALSNYQVPGGILGSALVARLPVAAASPAGVLIAANQLLANRVIELNISGTIRNPIISVRPIPLLTQEAARWFLGAGV